MTDQTVIVQALYAKLEAILIDPLSAMNRKCALIKNNNAYQIVISIYLPIH